MRKYVTCLIMGTQKAFEYRFDFFGGYFSAVFPIIIQVSMWTAIYGAMKNELLYGYSYQQMILYTFFVGVIGKFMVTGFEYEMNEDIKNGGLNKYIVKPINYYGYRAACFFGERCSAFTMFFIILCILFGVFKGMGFFQLSLMRIALFFVSLFFSLLLNFSLYFCVGTLGLWISEISRVFPAIQVIIMVISGGIFPLDILGENINKLILFLPFRYLLQFPVEIITGKEMSHFMMLTLFGIQIFWVTCLNLLAQIIWRRGLKKYIAVGG